MPFQVTVDPSRQWVAIIGTGTTDAAGFRAILSELVTNPAFHAGYRILVDSRELNFTPTTEETREFAKFHGATDSLKSSKVAVVVAKTVDYGMANMFAILCGLEDSPVRSFQSIAEAENWLAQN
jgi:hypothetical protein